jgi:pilus assembly protein Flp/PilA
MSIQTHIQRFVRDDEGVTMIEYALLAALIAVALIATIIVLEGGIQAVFTRIANCLNGAAGGTAPTC